MVISGYITGELSRRYKDLADIYQVSGITGTDQELGTILYILQDYSMLAASLTKILKNPENVGFISADDKVIEDKKTEDLFDEEDVPEA